MTGDGLQALLARGEAQSLPFTAPKGPLMAMAAILPEAFLGT